jgi:hypothetical protein
MGVHTVRTLQKARRRVTGAVLLDTTRLTIGRVGRAPEVNTRHLRTMSAFAIAAPAEPTRGARQHHVLPALLGGTLRVLAQCLARLAPQVTARMVICALESVFTPTVFLDVLLLRFFLMFPRLVC